MNIKYLFNSIELNDKEQRHLDNKVQKIEKFFKNCKNPDELVAVIDIDQDRRGFWRVEVMIRTPYDLFRVSKKGRRFRTVVDKNINILLNQISKNKEKSISKNRQKKNNKSK